ncbi:MAG TPA: DUF6787 family protein [Cytophagaceae bacterium]|jgi:hypothetical protein|nr:DUF6787 family protein [Cytophagaceae bacterium]
MTFFEKLKSRWQITSNWQLFMICVVFAITGSASAWVSAPVLKLLGITKDLGGLIFWPLRILIIFPIYQLLLVIIGTLFGQHKFFWTFEKKMIKRFGIDLDKSSNETQK